ncbi:MAG: hypothetical protein KC517_06425 [Bacteroidetes bacterium]|jgi:hypothetical protein|nr:hypothetical protein [Bacteroidota bacterium]
MNRKDFLKLCGILGIGVPLQGAMSGCAKDFVATKFSGKVIIIGAGPGGKSVGNKIFFAGGPYSDGNDWVSVHVAAASAKTAVTELLA